jgi:hypothetical protein
MWSLYHKFQQESELEDLITQLGGTFPFERTEEEKRMRTELLDAVEKNQPQSFSYSRGPGTGLRVPKHTDITGQPVSQVSPPVVSVPNPNARNGGNINGGVGQAPPQRQSSGQGQFWSGQGGNEGGRSMSFKEEDEYDMDIS